MPKRSNRMDLYFIAILTCFFLIFFIITFSLSSMARRVPQLICGIAVVLCLIVFLKDYLAKKITEDAAEESQDKAADNKGIPVYKTLLILVAYIFGLLILGFPLSTFVLLAYWPLMLGAKAHLRNIVFSILSTGVLYYVFTQLFYVRLPIGILFTSIFK